MFLKKNNFRSGCGVEKKFFYFYFFLAPAMPLDSALTFQLAIDISFGSSQKRVPMLRD